MARALITVGHGAADQAKLTALLRGAGVARLVDVRRYPGSRAHPHVKREAMSEWLPAAGISYRWDERLGGRRRLPEEAPDRWWQVASFRAYASHMRSPEFAAAVTDLIGDLDAGTTAIMCSESLWWRCHRRLIADFVTAVRGRAVVHLLHDGRQTAHALAEGARLAAGGLLYYDRA
ncbi:DUF488 domain-containing protein [Actinoplanes sp. NPDC023714]|uniref:DUF488 domain-containing protein n=1 Tax=Actinoplanes sp. NPDC023714 TaxID=3154322 RepID=UPI0033D727B8